MQPVTSLSADDFVWHLHRAPAKLDRTLVCCTVDMMNVIVQTLNKIDCKLITVEENENHRQTDRQREKVLERKIRTLTVER